MSIPVHPVFQDMLNLNGNSTQGVSLAFQVYMELSEVRRCWDVQYDYSPELNLIYFKTLDHKSQGEPELIVPLSTYHEVSPSWLHQAVSVLAKDCDTKSFTLAFKDSDSTVLLYKVFEGLEEPISLQDSQMAKMAEEKERLMEADLRKRQDQLYEIAKSQSD